MGAHAILDRNDVPVTILCLPLAAPMSSADRRMCVSYRDQLSDGASRRLRGHDARVWLRRWSTNRFGHATGSAASYDAGSTVSNSTAWKCSAITGRPPR